MIKLPEILASLAKTRDTADKQLDTVENSVARNTLRIVAHNLLDGYGVLPDDRVAIEAFKATVQ